MKINNEKRLVSNNIGISVMLEREMGATRYALIKIDIFGNNAYCICIDDDNFSFECVGEDELFARSFFDTMLRTFPKSEHLFDVVTDARREKLYC